MRDNTDKIHSNGLFVSMRLLIYENSVRLSGFSKTRSSFPNLKLSHFHLDSSYFFTIVRFF